MNDENLIAVLGQQIRVDIRWGTGIPLVLCNGIGASLEVLDPFVAQLDPDTTVVRFDVPGSGASPDSPFPYRFPYLAAALGMLLKKVGIIDQRAGISEGSPSSSPSRTRAGAAGSSWYPPVPVR
jgi:pimeloyl-ACP methyl ester carboxylesterase